MMKRFSASSSLIARRRMASATSFSSLLVGTTTRTFIAGGGSGAHRLQNSDLNASGSNAASSSGAEEKKGGSSVVGSLFERPSPQLQATAAANVNHAMSKGEGSSSSKGAGSDDVVFMTPPPRLSSDDAKHTAPPPSALIATQGPSFVAELPETWARASSAEEMESALWPLTREDVDRGFFKASVAFYFRNKSDTSRTLTVLSLLNKAHIQSFDKRRDILLKCLDDASIQPHRVVTLGAFASHVRSIISDFKLDFHTLPNRAVGLTNLAVGVSGLAEGTSRGLRVDGSQATTALVLKNASGVGKTFGSIAVSAFINANASLGGNGRPLYYPIYLGFNHKFPLNGNEEKFLGAHADKGIPYVLNRRLLVQLEVLAAACDNHQRQSLEQLVWNNDSFGIPVPTGRVFDDCQLFPDVDEDHIAELLCKIGSRCDAPRLNVLLIIDEGQRFDEFVPPSSGSGGARIALRWGRGLQRKVWDVAARNGGKPILALPIMTGIDPVTTLSNRTEGSNYIFSGEINTLEEFKSIIKGFIESQEVKKLRLSDVDRVSGLFFPVARDARFFISRRSLSTLSVSESLAPLQLIACVGRQQLPANCWHPSIPAVWAENQTFFTPLIPFFQADDMLLHVKWIGSPKAFRYSSLSEAFKESCYSFEDDAGSILSILMALVNTPAPAETKYEYAGQYEKCRAQLRNLEGAEWFRTSVDLAAPLMCVGIRKPKHCHCPSSALRKDHADAFEVKSDGSAKFSLHPTLLSTLQGVMRNGSVKGKCVWVQCGGSAPVDFIFICMTSDVVNGKCDVDLMMADAKHVSKDPKLQNVTEMRDMCDRFRVVSKYLSAALDSNGLGMRIVNVKSAIVSNVECAENVRDLLHENGVFEVSSGTLTAPPFTTYLFAQNQ